jgi:hypothetical protein
MIVRLQSGTWARWILGGVILAASYEAGLAHAATARPAALAAIGPARIGRIAVAKPKEPALAMRPSLRRPTEPPSGSRANGMTHIGIDGGAVHPRK